MVATLAFLFTACDDDDNQGYSGITPTNPTISVDVPASGVNLVETKATYLFDVTLSEPQVVDIAIYIKTIAGTATEGEDFTIDNGNSRVYIPAGKTAGTVSITVLEDELLEETETFTIQIGDERTSNTEISPVEVNFTLTNLTKDDLAIGLSWETDVAEAIGLDLDPDEVVDLRLLLVDVATDMIYAVEDGGSFEEYIMDADVPDGEYLLAVDVYSTINAGDYNATVTLDLELQFDQVGVINHKVLSFPQVMTNQYVCEAYRTNLAVVTKSGFDYSIEESISYVKPQAVEWFGTDAGYESQVTTIAGCDLLIFGLNHGWMEDFWGEEVIAENNVSYTIDEKVGTVEILEQNYITTLYNGSEYPYTIKGSGTIDNSGEFTTMTITYEVFQDGFSPSKWAFDNGYQDEPYFTATLTLDPVGIPVVSSVVKSSKLIAKPVRK